MQNVKWEDVRAYPYSNGNDTPRGEEPGPWFQGEAAALSSIQKL